MTLILHRHLADYQGRIWATRRRPRVDRLADSDGATFPDDDQLR